MTIPTAPPPGQRRAQSKNVFIGCLIALAVFVVIVGVGGWWLYTTVRGAFISAVVNDIRPQIVADINASALPEAQKRAAIASVDRVVGDLEHGRISIWDHASWINSGRGAAHAWVAELDLPPDQKAGLGVQIDRLADGSIDGTIGEPQWNAITRHLETGPLMTMVGVWAVKVQHLYPADLPADEKAAAETTLHRTARGVSEGAITQAELDAVTAPYMTTDPQTGDREMRPLTTDELRTVIAQLESLADERAVPPGDWQPDYAGELKKAIDQALGITPELPAESP